MPKRIYKRTEKHLRQLVKQAKRARTFITEESIKKAGEARKGVKRPWISKLMKGGKLSKEHKEKIRIAAKKRKHSMKTRKKMRKSQMKRFQNHFHITPFHEAIRKSFEYRQWRKEVFERDNYTCQCCQQLGGKIIAHHIKAFSKILRENKIKTFKQAVNCKALWDINNGITFCEECHELTDNYGYKANEKSVDVLEKTLKRRK